MDGNLQQFGPAHLTLFLYLLGFAFVLILIIRGRPSQSGHLVDDTKSSQLVQEDVSTFIHQVSDDLQSQEVTVVVVLTDGEKVRWSTGRKGFALNSI